MANNQSIDPWHLFKTHQYEEAVAAYDAQLAAGEDPPAILANRATALLCCGRLSEALEGFATANDVARQSRATPKSAPFLVLLCQTYPSFFELIEVWRSMGIG